jgi:hypothetical protein
MSPRLEILLDMPPASKEVQLKHAWNQDDRFVDPRIFISIIQAQRRQSYFLNWYSYNAGLL